MSVNVKLVNLKGEILKDVAFTKTLLVDKVNKQAMFDTVIAENNAMRQGTHSTLTKGEVRGGGKKPWMQKHTGNARQGSTRNPQWVGGGVAFGPKPNRNYKVKVNRKVVHLAFKSALTKKVNDKNLYLLDLIKMEKPATKKIANFLKKLELDNQKILFILNNDNTVNIAKSINNMPKAIAKNFNQVSTKDVMHANTVIIQENTVELLGKVYK